MLCNGTSVPPAKPVSFVRLAFGVLEYHRKSTSDSFSVTTISGSLLKGTDQIRDYLVGDFAGIVTRVFTFFNGIGISQNTRTFSVLEFSPSTTTFFIGIGILRIIRTFTSTGFSISIAVFTRRRCSSVTFTFGCGIIFFLLSIIRRRR